MTTTFRQDVAAGLLALLEAFIVTNPTLLRRAFIAQPPHFNVDLPCAFVGPRPETASHVQGTRTRTLSPSITFVDRITDNAETQGRMDRLVDAFADHLTASPHIAPNTIWEDWTVTDGPIEIGDGAVLYGTTFTLSDLTAMEGRT